jgi:initiation factor 1A
MPRKRAKKNAKTRGGDVVRRTLETADLDSQVYGTIDAPVGGSYFSVICLDGVTRRCKVRSKRLRIAKKDVVIVSLRDFSDNNGDIIYKYDQVEVRELQRANILPSDEALGTEADSDIEDDAPFEFGDI